MFRTVGDGPSAWAVLLTPEVLRLPGVLARREALLDAAPAPGKLHKLRRLQFRLVERVVAQQTQHSRQAPDHAVCNKPMALHAAIPAVPRVRKRRSGGATRPAPHRRQPENPWNNHSESQAGCKLAGGESPGVEPQTQDVVRNRDHQHEKAEIEREDAAAEAVEVALGDGPEAAMNRFNRKPEGQAGDSTDD